MSAFAEFCAGCLPPSDAYLVRPSTESAGSLERSLVSAFADGTLDSSLSLRQSQFLAALHVTGWHAAELQTAAELSADRLDAGLFPVLGKVNLALSSTSEPDRLARLVEQFRDSDRIAEALQQLRSATKFKDTLLHADLKSNATFIDNGRIIVVPSPSSCLGPRAVDVATLVVSYLLYYYVHQRCEQDNDSHRQFAYKLTELCQSAVEEYVRLTSDLPDESSTCGLGLMSQVAGFTGCLLASRALDNDEVIGQADLVTEVLEAGIRLLNVCDRIESIGKLIFIALMLC